MADDPALSIFSSEYLPSLSAAKLARYATWRSQNPGEAAKWDAFVQAVLAGQQVAPPVLATAYGKMLVAAGEMAMAVSRLTAQIVPVVPPPPPPTGLNFYVSLGGNDSTGNGSSASPWRTIRKACQTVTPGQSATINVAAGTFVETGTCALPSTTNLVGAGAAATIVRASSSAVTPLMSVQNTTGPQAISDIQFDGQSRTTSDYGLFIRNATFLTVTRIQAQGFKFAGNFSGAALDFQNVTDFELSFSTLTNSGGSGSGYSNGVLGIGQCTRALLHDLTVSADSTAYAVKGSGQTPTYTDMEISNSSFAQTTGTSVSSITFELFTATGVNCRIHNNNFDGIVSLTGPVSNPTIGNPKTNGGNYRYRVDHNRWTIVSGSRYCVESSSNSMQIDHNYVNGGLYPFSYFETYTLADDWIHHNVIDNTFQPVAFSHFASGITGTIYEKNTVVLRNSYTIGVFNGLDASDSIIDSIFFATAGIGDNLNGGAATIDNNDFWNITSHGTNAITTNPGLSLSGGFPGAYAPSGAPWSALGAFEAGTFVVGPQ